MYYQILDHRFNILEKKRRDSVITYIYYYDILVNLVNSPRFSWVDLVIEISTYE